jgi:hypothetical protein
MRGSKVLSGLDNYPCITQPGNLFVRIAVFGKYLGGMLAEGGRR